LKILNTSVSVAPAGPPGGEDLDLGERLEAEDHEHHEQEEQDRRDQREGDAEQRRARPVAVERGRLQDLVGDRLEPGEHDDEGEAEVLPDGRDGGGRQASVGSLSHWTWKKPTAGLNRNRKITDDTATEEARVDEKIAWNTLMPRSRRWAATASSVPSSRPRGTVKSTYSTLCQSPSPKSEPVRTSRYCSVPTEV
jgi:hypothetical protein